MGHIDGAKGIRPDPDKLTAVTDWPAPHNIHALRKSLGLTEYFRKFLRGYCQRRAPLTHLLRKKVAYEWNQTCQEAFEQLKTDLISIPKLVSPDTYHDTYIPLNHVSSLRMHVEQALALNQCRMNSQLLLKAENSSSAKLHCH